jgi:site-specific DNA-methyltransferase (adenine-specific)
MKVAGRGALCKGEEVLYFKGPFGCIYQGDCLSILRELPDDSHDALVTDPPYCSGGATPQARRAAPEVKYKLKTDAIKTGFGGDARDPQGYLLWCTLWLLESRRVLRDGSAVCVFTDWRQLGLAGQALQAADFIYRGVAVWDKTQSARPQRGRFRAQAEFVVWGSKGKLAQDGPCLPGVWSHSAANKTYHITEKTNKSNEFHIGDCTPRPDS